MAYELYPSKHYCKKWGKNDIPDAQGTTRYPGKALPNTQDDTSMSKIMQKGNGMAPAADTYPQKPCPRFGIEGLPS